MSLLFFNYKVHYKVLMLLLSMGISSACFSQNQESEEVIRQQRAIFIFNFAQQIIWPSIDEIDTFKIGVLGTDPTLSNINKMAQKRPIQGKKVEIIGLSSIYSIGNVDIIYVNKKYGFQIQSIINAIGDDSILLITEGYDYNTSMINMIATDGTYKYEINKTLIESANLKAAPTLEEYAVSSIDKWEELYKDAEKELFKVARENQEQKEIIEQQEEEIGDQKIEIDLKEEAIIEKNYSLKNLTIDRELKNIKLKEKLKIEKDLEKKINKQLEQLELQKVQIQTINEQIEEQQKFLEIQKADIKEKAKILEENTLVIAIQKRNTMILLALSSLLLIGIIWILMNYLRNKKLNNRLSEQHIAITKQSNQLESKNKELEQFAYIASHDLQEPLNTVSSFIDLIKLEYDDKFDEDGRQSLDFIKEASIRMKKLIDALLQYSRLGRDIDFEMVDCNTVLNNLEADLKTSIEESNTTISYTNLPTIQGNAIEIRLLFQNLISNGIKFRKPGVNPKITIDYKKTYDEEDDTSAFWEFSITDNGIGIPSKYKDRIFGIFQRLHSREDFKGAGIGLAHCKKIVEAHDGDIWLESKEGEGSTFFVSIPVA